MQDVVALSDMRWPLGRSAARLHSACLGSTSLPMFGLAIVRHCQDGDGSRWEPPTLSFTTSLQIPMGDLKDTMSMFYIVYV